MFTKRNWLKVTLLAVLVASLIVPGIAAAQTAAQTGIISPTDGATLKGTVDFKAVFPGDPYMRWDLFILPGGSDADKIWVATGSEAGEATLALDTTKYPDGQHAFSLRLVKPDSNYDEQIVNFTIANAAAAPAASAATPDIVDTAVAAGSFKTLVAAVQAAGLVDTLKGTGPYTVFAPTDEAFTKLPAGTVDNLLKDPEALANILLYHVVPGKVMAAQVTDGMTAKTVQGSTVTFTVAGDNVKINDANITATDIEASNGVIHVIDSVILPPADAPAATTPAAQTGILSPTDGATLSGTVEFKANFPGDPYTRWDLFILPGGSDDAKIGIATGDKVGEATLLLDTTQYPNGEHAFSLRLVKPDRNYDEQIVNFTIANATTAPAAPTATPDIVDTAVAAGSFETLVAAVQAAGLVGTLQGTGPYTVFAPTDEAFAKLPAGTVDNLLKDPEALANILLYHVVPGKVMAAQVTDGMTAKTVQGSTVTFTVAGDNVKINDANITATDIEASNGVIHVIDSVILPPADAPAAATPAAQTGIISPTDGATLSGTVEFKAVFPGDPYIRWDLFILPGGSDDAKIGIATGDKVGEATLLLDTTQYPNGEHAFSLRLVKPDRNYDEQIVKFTIAN